jgi:carnitine 3-dehydrogenase
LNPINFPQIHRIGILGTGTIGASWASFYASRGITVKLFDSQPESLNNGLTTARQNLDDLQKFELADGETVEKAWANLTAVTNFTELVRDVEFIHESVVESYDVKKAVFARLDEMTAPSTIIASSSSGLLLTEIQRVMNHPQRSLIAHPFNPPHLIPLVELVPGRQTRPDVIQTMHSFYQRLGKIPVVLKKEVPGHIANRLAAALWREAIDLVATGVASVEDVDKALYAGPGTRWAFMGQHLTYHLGGGEGGYRYFIDHIGTAFETYWREMATWTEIPDAAKTAVISGVEDFVGNRSLTELARWRDERLVKLLKVLYGERDDIGVSHETDENLRGD